MHGLAIHACELWSIKRGVTKVTAITFPPLAELKKYNAAISQKFFCHHYTWSYKLFSATKSHLPEAYRLRDNGGKGKFPPPRAKFFFPQ